MTVFEHETTGARVTYPEGHRLHALLTSSGHWHPIEDLTASEEEGSEGSGTEEEGSEDERPASPRGRGRRAATAAD